MVAVYGYMFNVVVLPLFGGEKLVVAWEWYGSFSCLNEMCLSQALIEAIQSTYTFHNEVYKIGGDTTDPVKQKKAHQQRGIKTHVCGRPPYFCQLHTRPHHNTHNHKTSTTRRHSNKQPKKGGVFLQGQAKLLLWKNGAG